MNKISKKIVSLVTMAAFALTLVPAAAFAADTDFSLEASQVKVVTPAGQTEGDVSVFAKDDLTLHFDLKNVGGGNYSGTDVVNFTGYNDANTLQVWAVNNATEKVTDALIVEGIDTNCDGIVDITPSNGAQTATDTDFNVVVSFTRDGSYTIYAGLGANQENAEENPFSSDKKINTVTVKAEETTVNAITLTPSSIEEAPNSFESIPVTATVSGVKAGTDTEATNFDGKVVSIKNDNESKGVSVYKSGTETVTNEATVSDDKASFDVKIVNGALAGKYPIYLSCDEGEATLYVTVEGNNKATSIEVVDTDSEYVDMTAPEFAGVAEVVFKDAEGNVVAKPATVNKEFVVYPDGASVDASKLTLKKVDGTDNYKLSYDGTLKAG